ncbi:MAG: helix-turn-helix domain-containing protein [Saprospiraceae bacterium]
MMNGKIQYQRIIFGLKIKQLRQEVGLSFAEMAAATGMSVSYLNEIEKGKKFPKGDKVSVLAKVLKTKESTLLSLEMDPQLAPVAELLQSNFLNELPLDMFGIELGKVAEIIASAPLRVGAFISALLDISRSYALREENFYFAALRAYLELNFNYFQHIEDAVDALVERYNLGQKRPFFPDKLKDVLIKEYEYHIDAEGLDAYPNLQGLRSVYLPSQRTLLLRKQLTPIQASFQYGKEIGFHFLELKERANTSSLLRGKNFQEVLNHAFATYFSVALHIPLEPFVASIQQFFASERWDGEGFIRVMNQFDATPEMFYHRLTNVLPRFFNMPKLFFLRVLHDPANDRFEVDRELHLAKPHRPHSNALLEHYCRRWVSLSLLHDLDAMQREGKYVSTIVRAQRSKYYDTEDEYLVITLARSGMIGTAADLRVSAQRHNVSVSIGLLIDDEVRRSIQWLDDPAIQTRVVNMTCERCSLKDCTERAAAPSVVEKRERLKAMEQELGLLE